MLKWTSIKYNSQDTGELIYEGFYYTTTYSKNDLYVIFEMTCILRVKYVLATVIKICQVTDKKDLHFQEK